MPDLRSASTEEIDAAVALAVRLTDASAEFEIRRWIVPGHTDEGGRVLQRDCGLCCAGCTEKTAPSSVSERLGRWHSLQCLGAPWQRVIIMLKKIYYLKFLEQEDKDEEEEAVEITGVIE
ncbi:hypothetical protein Ndes2526B_g00519 [Nannochloris sp. 'desiccata']|nr:hypothetical protein NADE_003683 [Chlorella desiccata (nom. nud.)]